ncbi:MAG: hypothetical protein AB7N76_35420 [Planctomycetota bacterium]
MVLSAEIAEIAEIALCERGGVSESETETEAEIESETEAEAGSRFGEHASSPRASSHLARVMAR